MSFPEAVKTCFQKYFRFSDRAVRSEYWWFILFLLVFSFVTAFLDGLLFPSGLSPLNTLFALATTVPGIAAASRHLHETERLAWWQGVPYVLLTLLAISGDLLLNAEVEILGIVMVSGLGVGVLVSVIQLPCRLTQPRDPGTNQYGTHPTTTAEVF